MFTLITNGEVYAPRPLGRMDVLIAAGKIVRVGAVDRHALDALGVEYRVLEARGCYVVPGFIDPHVHLLGGSGESGFNTQTPEFHLSEIVQDGTTTVVGTLGVDATMKTMAGLLARAKGLKADGLNAYVWTGGYDAPHASILGSVREDVMFIEEVIGAGEVAISDPRAMQLTTPQLGKLLSDTHVGGMLSGKAGIVHFHVGELPTRLQPLRDVLDAGGVEPCWMYATHLNRSDELMEEGVELAKKGMFVDVDTIEGDAHRWLRLYMDAGGPPENFTFSSDASATGTGKLYQAVRSCVVEHDFPLEQILSHVTLNTARILKLPQKGEIATGKVGDAVVLGRDDLDVVHVVSRGVPLVEDGRLCAAEAFLDISDRHIHMVGTKDPNG
jgi:beta-aspartyl-dipeptidase (metallo-type)